jgi:gliding motility-associated-like protein
MGFPGFSIGMFEGATAFNQDLSTWDISSIVHMDNMFDNSAMSRCNYDATLEGWSTLENTETTIPTGITLGAIGLYYSNTTAHNVLTDNYNWTIIDEGETIPTFTQVADICEGNDPLDYLPTTSIEGIVGTWEWTLSFVNGNREYTFTPDANQCANSTTMMITINPEPSAPIVTNANPIFCASNNLTVADLNITNATTITSPSGTIVTSTDTLENGNYTAIQTLNSCDSQELIINVTINNTITPIIDAIEDIRFCDGNETQEIIFTSNIEDITYEWSNNNPAIGLTASGTGNIPIFTGAEGEAKITVTPINGDCVGDSFEFYINIVSELIPTFNTLKTSYCYGETPEELPTTSSDGFTGYWEPNIIDTENTNISAYTFYPEGDDCAVETAIEITINPLPEVDVLENIFAIDQYILPILNIGNQYYTETNASGEELFAGDAITTAQTIYIFTDNGVCSNESSFNVSFSLFVPNAFTPNDDGFNDTYNVKNITVLYPDYMLYFYDRWGSLVYKGKNGWDGISTSTRSFSKEKVRKGAYYVIIDLGNGETLKQSVVISY